MSSKGASTEIDFGTGHGPYHPRQSGPTPCSPNVNVNGNKSARVGDTYTELHIKPGNVPDPHPGNISAGSSTVRINGQAAARIGDAVDCGSQIASGSGNVFIGG